MLARRQTITYKPWILHTHWRKIQFNLLVDLKVRALKVLLGLVQLHEHFDRFFNYYNFVQEVFVVEMYTNQWCTVRVGSLSSYSRTQNRQIQVPLGGTHHS